MMSAQHKLLLRADASTEIGSGHLAQAWQETDGNALLVLAYPVLTLESC